MYLPDFLWQIHLQHVLRIIRRLPKISPFFQLFVLSYFSSYSVHNKLTKKPIVSCCLLDRRDERLEIQYFRGTTLLHSFKNALISDAITSCFINVKPTFKSYQPDHSMVSSKFDLSCLAPTDNSLTKTFLLLLHFLVFCAFIISPHFHLCKHFLTFVFSKFKPTFYIHQKKGTHYPCIPSISNNFSFLLIPPAYPVKYLI